MLHRCSTAAPLLRCTTAAPLHRCSTAAPLRSTDAPPPLGLDTLHQSIFSTSVRARTN
ncbi:hypothetical protein Hanom_Chr00s200379g01837781 [Helianthus anomalus]